MPAHIHHIVGAGVDQPVGSKHFLLYAGNVILDNARACSGACFTPRAGIQLYLAKINNFRVYIFLLKRLHKGVYQPTGVALQPTRTSINNQNIHTVSPASH
jgi:hypothetical protein